MSQVSIVYHSGFGHTKALAEAVRRGAESVPGTRVEVISVEGAEIPWDTLAACLPALRASRERPAGLDAALFMLEPYAEALAGVSQHLFESQAPAPARNVVVSLLAERLLLNASGVTPLGDLDVRGWARGLLDQWPPPGDGTRPGRVHAAIVRGRLSRFADGKSPPMPAISVALAAWRAARA